MRYLIDIYVPVYLQVKSRLYYSFNKYLPYSAPIEFDHLISPKPYTAWNAGPPNFHLR
jgi:hypothetical protein